MELNDELMPENTDEKIETENTVNEEKTVEEIDTASKTAETTTEDIENPSPVVLNEAQQQVLDNTVTTEPTKKKSALQVPIIIALCIVIGALLGFGIYYGFFAHTVNGTWECKVPKNELLYDSTAEESEDAYDTFYYTFKDDGVVTMTMGTIDFNGEYSVTSNEDGTQTIMIGQYYGTISGEYTMTISGSRLFGNQVMKLVAADGTEVELNQSSVPKDILKKADDFKADEKLIGEWEYVFEDYGISYKFVFNADGTMQINQYDAFIYNCVYTTDGSVIECTFYTTEEQTEEIEYSFDGDSLIIMGLKCERVGESTPSQK